MNGFEKLQRQYERGENRMTGIAETIKQWGEQLPLPKVFDITVHYEPSAHFRFTRKIRNDFNELAMQHGQSTWLLGSHGGKARMQTDIQGIGLATRLEVGRLSVRQGRQYLLLESAFKLCKVASEKGLSSGDVDRLAVKFPKAVFRENARVQVSRAFKSIFGGPPCVFLAVDENHIELGYCVKYQGILQFMREDGVFHSAHREQIELLLRHLHQEVGRYENVKFFVRPKLQESTIPHIDYIYTGGQRERSIEAYVEGYTKVKPEFVAIDEFDRDRKSYVSLKDYERASRRFGGIGVKQNDIVRHLNPNQVGVLYLFLEKNLQLEEGKYFGWSELHERQKKSEFIRKSARHSSTFLDEVLETLVKARFLLKSDQTFALYPGFSDFEHVSFYSLGSYGK